MSEEITFPKRGF